MRYMIRVTQPARLCLLLLLQAALHGLPASVRAQVQTPAEAAAATRTNSLGMTFTAVANTPVLFATQEVRVTDWQAFLSASGYQWSYRPHFDQGPDHPAVGITLQDAKAFCNWLTDKERKAGALQPTQSYRLPTLEEWDAAVGMLSAASTNLSVEDKLADDGRLPWGADWPPPPQAGNFAADEIPGYEDDYPFTAPVGRFKPSPDGLFDLSGNVWEWCWNPVVQAQQNGVLRGGSWAYFRRECLTSGFRYQVPADLRMPTIGFRCVFEDRDRTTTLLAAARVADTQARAQRREEVLGSTEVDPAALEAMRKSFAAASAAADVPNPSTLIPAIPGRPYVNLLGMEFQPLPGGPLLIGAHEVRLQDFEAWLTATSRDWPHKPPFTLGSNHPAPGVTWPEAQAFCEWLTTRDQAANLIPPNARYRLPTDLEWSRAAGLPEESGADPAQRDRAEKTHYPWSATGAFPPRSLSVNLDAARITDYNDSYAYTAPVTAEAAAENGIVGLGGNVAEWCADEWPGAPAERVIRGGSWQSFDKEALLTSARRHAPGDRGYMDVGFRCLLELPAAP